MDNPKNKDVSNPIVQEPPILSKHFHFPRVLMILFVVVITAIIFGFIGFILGITIQRTGTIQPTNIKQTKSTVSTNLTASGSIELDLKRIINLTSLSSAVNVYAQQHRGKLPTNLQAPELSTYGYVFSFTDPQTKKSYGYHINSPDIFTLCTTFSNDSTIDYNNSMFLNKTFALQAPPMSYKKGYSCIPFTLIITQDNYKAAGETKNVIVSPTP